MWSSAVGGRRDRGGDDGGVRGTVIRSPYHPDLGWAGDGRTWNWVALDIDASSWQDTLQSSGGFCDDVSLEVSATIGGEVAALDLVNPVGSYSSSWVAFFVIPGAAAEPPGEIEVSTIVSCSPGPDGSAPTETFTGTYPLAWY